MRIDFYHLTSAPLEKVLPSICEKLVANGERLLVVAGERQVEGLDAELWSYGPESFLPHALDRQYRRSALASSFVAALELARTGKVELAQEGPFAPLMVRRT